MEKELFVDGLECDSCAKAVSRVAASIGVHLARVDVAAGKVFVDCSGEKLEELKKALAGAGYGVDSHPARGSFSSAAIFFKNVFFDKEFGEERKILEASLLCLFAMVTLVALVALLPQFSFAKQFVPLLAVTAIGTFLVFVALAHWLSFAKPSSCMCGMMVGMTIGMAAGFLSGAVAGASNGMFAGSVAGMLVGMTVGALAGKPVGAMGVLEGLMAGLMGGTMGAMLTVMLFGDNVVLFLVLLLIAFAVILSGLSYVVFREGGSVQKNRFGTGSIAIVLLFFIIFSSFLLWGPRSALAFVLR